MKFNADPPSLSCEVWGPGREGKQGETENENEMQAGPPVLWPVEEGAGQLSSQAHLRKGKELLLVLSS